MHFTRRSLVAGALGAAAAASLPLPLMARAPKVAAQAPGFFRHQVGSLELTALTDGFVDLGIELFTGGTPPASEVLDRNLATSVNAWLVNTGERLVLIDAGAASAMGDTLGHLEANMEAAGYSPDQVDAVVITHLHADHALGAVRDGKPAFANAELHVAETELAFWSDDAVMAAAPDEAKPYFKFARDAVKPYSDADRLTVFKPGEILPGLHAEDAPGHTPGHTMVRIASGDRQLLIWGDVVHYAGLQIPEPDRAIAFDTDQAQAIETRKRVLDMVATDRIEIAGSHIPFPGIGQVVRTSGGYRYIGAPWAG